MYAEEAVFLLVSGGLTREEADQCRKAVAKRLTSAASWKERLLASGMCEGVWDSIEQGLRRGPWYRYAATAGTNAEAQ